MSSYGSAPQPALTPRPPIVAALFGDPVNPALAQPHSPVQRILVQNISAARTMNMWMMAALGALLAGVVGLLLTLISLALWSSAIDSLLAATNTNPLISAIDSEFKSLLTPNVLQLFAIEQHVPLGIAISAGADVSGVSGNASGDVTIGLPLTGLLLLPALALTLGGYFSAASDFQRSPRFSIMRGALIAPFYAVFLAIIAVLGRSSISAGAFGFSASATAQPVIWQAFLYGLLWGLVFGALGGWLHYSGAHFLSWGLPVLQRASTQLAARITGALTGAVVAYVSGFLLSLVAIVGLYVYSIVTSAASAPITTPASASATSASGAGSLGVALILIVVLSPTAASWAFALAGGAPFHISATTTLSSGSNQEASVGLFGTSSNMTGFTAPHIPPTWYLALLLPAIAYLIGGRVAARVARATTPGEGALVGALMAIPLSIIMAIAAALAGLSIDISVVGLGGSLSYAPSVGGAFLAVLIGAAIVGAIGGATAVTAPQLAQVPRMLTIPVRPLAFALYPVFDTITRRPQGVNRSESREWLYGAALLGVALGIVVIALDVITVATSSVLPFKTLVVVDGIAACVLVALPLMFMVGAVVAAFAQPMLVVAPPAAPGQPAAPALAGAPAMAYSPAPYAPAPYAPAPYAPAPYAPAPYAPMAYPTPATPMGQMSAPMGVPMPAAGQPSAPVAAPIPAPTMPPDQSSIADAPTVADG